MAQFVPFLRGQQITTGAVCVVLVAPFTPAGEPAPEEAEGEAHGGKCAGRDVWGWEVGHGLTTANCGGFVTLVNYAAALTALDFTVSAARSCMIVRSRVAWSL